MKEVPQLDAVWVNGEHYHRQTLNQQLGLDQQPLHQQQNLFPTREQP